MPAEPEPCCFDDWARANATRARTGEAAGPVGRQLLAALGDGALRGRTILDVGCGAGDVVLAALDRGARFATGIDLGPGAIETARRLAEERRLADRASFSIGDGATADLPAADVVVLNRVVCCYPDATALLENSVGAAGGTLAYTAPADRGIAGLWNRLSTGFGNAWFAIRRRRYAGFRAYVHPLAQIDASIERAGFRAVRRERCRFVWRVAVFERP